MSEPKRRNVFLAPPEVSAGDDDNDGEKAFQVIRMAPKGDQVHTMVFSSSTGQWQAGPSAILEEATASRLFTVVGVTSNCHAQFAHGSFYFLTGKGRETVRLELSSMEISIFNGPPAAAVRGSYFGIMEEKNGAFGLIQVITERLSGEFNYWISEGPIAGPWKLKKTVEVDELQHTFFSCGGKQAFVDNSTHWHSLDIRTLEFQEICNSFDTMGYPYSNIPKPYAIPLVTQDHGVMPESSYLEIESDDYDFGDFPYPDFQLKVEEGDDSGVEDDNDKDDDGSGGVDASGSSELQSQAVEQLKVPDLSHLISNAGALTTAQDDADDEDVAGDDPGQRAEV